MPSFHEQVMEVIHTNCPARGHLSRMYKSKQSIGAKDEPAPRRVWEYHRVGTRITPRTELDATQHPAGGRIALREPDTWVYTNQH